MEKQIHVPSISTFELMLPQVAVMRGLLPGQPPPVLLLTSGKLGTLIKTINPNSFFHSCAPVHFLLHTSSSCKLRLEFRAELQAEFRAELEDRSGRMAFQLQHVRSCVPRDRHVLSTAISQTGRITLINPGCYYQYRHYDEGDQIITNEPCLNCTCHNQMLMCFLR